MDAFSNLPRATSISIIKDHAHLLDLLEGSTRASDPEEMAKRGFSLLATESGSLIKRIDALIVGQRVKGIVGHGSFVAKVEEVSNRENGRGETGA